MVKAKLTFVEMMNNTSVSSIGDSHFDFSKVIFRMVDKMIQASRPSEHVSVPQSVCSIYKYIFQME